MHVRVRFFGKPDTVVVVDSLLTTIDNFRRIIQQKFDVHPNSQKLIYGGKLLENGYTFYDYNIKLNDVIQLMVKIQSESNSNDDNKLVSDENTTTPVEYKDAKSTLYEVGDLVDMREPERGVWLEGKIIRIVQDPTAPNIDETIKETETVIDNRTETDNNSNTDVTVDYESENKSLCKCDPKSKDGGRVTKNKDLRGYFQTIPRSQQKKSDNTTKMNVDETKKCDINSCLLYKVQLDTDDDDGTYCKLQDIRPRARREIKVTDLEVGQTVMVNYDIDNPLERGYWYDFKISEIIQKLKSNVELIGTLYIGPDAVPQNDTKVTVHDKIFAIEQVVPLAERTKEYKKLMVTPPEKRTAPVNCLTCQDDEDAKCRDCGCYTCSGKDSPSKILLCDECNKGFHMWCLIPPITEIPKDDWYCPSCKRDPNDVIAPGGSKQMKKTAKSKRDWGRGMACVGKTRTCAMPANHFGPIPGIEVGMCWRYRIQLSETGVHRPPVSGIHGRDVEGAYSIVLSGGYEDDEDNGEEFTYTGSGGRDLSGNKRTAGQSCDQTLTRENKALARNCAVKEISEEGGDAGEQWRNGKPVRVVRSYKLSKHLPKYAPAEGIRYDGIYKVVKYYPAKGLSGFRVWKYLLRRDDPNPAPWEPEAKQYPIVYPDGHLEAEAEKKALKLANANKKKKRTLKESNEANKIAVPEDKNVSARKKRKMCISSGDEEEKDGYRKSANRDKFQTTRTNDENYSTNKTTSLSDEEKTAIIADALNKKLWDEVVTVCNARGKKEFVEYVTQEFRCIICQDVVVSPVTTPCLHNFCMGCIKLSFKAAGPQCPCCRQSLHNYEFEPNEELKTALRIILPGYDAGKK